MGTIGVSRGGNGLGIEPLSQTLEKVDLSAQQRDVLLGCQLKSLCSVSQAIFVWESMCSHFSVDLWF